MTETLRLLFVPLKTTSKVKMLVTTVGILFAVSASAVAADPIDVSHIIDQATAESVLGVKVKEAAPRNVRGDDGYYSKCNYYSVPPGKTLVIRLYRAAEGYNPQTELDVIRKTTPGLKEFYGIGDQAVITNGTASGLPPRALMLYVVKGNALITIGLNGFDDGPAVLDKTKEVAEKILAQL